MKTLPRVVAEMALHVLAYSHARHEHHGTGPADRGNPDLGRWAETVCGYREPGLGRGFITAAQAAWFLHDQDPTRTLRLARDGTNGEKRGPKKWLGRSLLKAVAPLGAWAQGHVKRIAKARAAFDKKIDV